MMAAMNAPALALSGLYAALALLLISLQLKSAWRWSVKAGAILLALPAVLAAYQAIQAQLGWPSRDHLPENFQLHAALIDEPAAKDEDGSGAIYLWLTPWGELDLSEMDDVDAAILPSKKPRPRAYDLPYSRELHQKVQTMQEHLARGEMVMGRHQAGKSWQRRFRNQGGSIDLEAPPPPPLPKKER